MFQLHFENQVFQNLSDFEQKGEDFPPFLLSALAFCKEWKLGKEEFSQFTSGSTGTPKEIKITRKQMEASAKGSGDFFEIHPNSPLLCCLNTDYIAGKMMLVRAMLWDCPIWLESPNSDPLANFNQHFELVAMVPLQVESSLSNDERLTKLQKIKHLIIGGAPISETLKARILSHSIAAWQTYGMTETVSHIALAKVQEGELIYHCLPGVEIGQDERDALWVTAEMSQNERVQTNDLIELISPTSFRWLGRADFVINSGGLKLFPETLEKKAEPIIRTLFPEARFFLFGKADEKLGERLVLILESGQNSEKSEALLKQLRQVLGKYEVPKEVIFTPSFEMTPSGKVNRKLTFDKLCKS